MSPLYVAINFFEASEAPLPFSLSDSEKVALMAMGESKDIQAQPKYQEPTVRVVRMALRAFRSYIESVETPSENFSKHSIEEMPARELLGTHEFEREKQGEFRFSR